MLSASPTLSKKLVSLYPNDDAVGAVVAACPHASNRKNPTDGLNLDGCVSGIMSNESCDDVYPLTRLAPDANSVVVPIGGIDCHAIQPHLGQTFAGRRTKA